MATLELRKWTGSAGAPSKAVKSLTAAANLVTEDGNDLYGKTVKPIQAGSRYSYWTVLRPNVSANPGAENVASLRVWFERADLWPAGVDMRVGLATSYVQATGTDNLGGDELTLSAYSTLKDLGGGARYKYARDIASSATALELAGSTTSTGEDTFDFIVLQLEWDAGSEIGMVIEPIIHLEYTPG